MYRKPGDVLCERSLTRREAIAAAACVFAAALHGQSTQPEAPGPIIDIHQHTNYVGRSNEALFHHQKKLGATKTLLLPGGTSVNSPSTLNGQANGLQARAGGFETCLPIVKEKPGEYYTAANEVPDIADARKSLESQLKQGAILIAEQKFNLPVDGKEMAMIYELAQEHQVPVLMHFQFETFNTGYERFGEILKKWRKVVFIGHAQTFWANIDAKHADQKVLYPKGKVTPGGWTDKYLADYPNLFADMSAGSGLNALTRDEDHARGFIERHQDKLLYGSDCPDVAGEGPTCTGSSQIKAIRRLSPNKKVERKLLHDNSAKLFKL